MIFKVRIIRIFMLLIILILLIVMFLLPGARNLQPHGRYCFTCQDYEDNITIEPNGKYLQEFSSIHLSFEKSGNWSYSNGVLSLEPYFIGYDEYNLHKLEVPKCYWIDFGLIVSGDNLQHPVNSNIQYLRKK